MSDFLLKLLEKLPWKVALAVLAPFVLFGGGYIGGNTAISAQVAQNKAMAQQSLEISRVNERSIAQINNTLENIDQTLTRYQNEGRLETRESIELLYLRELTKLKTELLAEIRRLKP